MTVWHLDTRSRESETLSLSFRQGETYSVSGNSVTDLLVGLPNFLEDALCSGVDIWSGRSLNLVEVVVNAMIAWDYCTRWPSWVFPNLSISVIHWLGLYICGFPLLSMFFRDKCSDKQGLVMDMTEVILTMIGNDHCQANMEVREHYLSSRCCQPGLSQRYLWTIYMFQTSVSFIFISQLALQIAVMMLTYLMSWAKWDDLRCHFMKDLKLLTGTWKARNNFFPTKPPQAEIWHEDPVNFWVRGDGFSCHQVLSTSVCLFSHQLNLRNILENKV